MQFRPRRGHRSPGFLLSPEAPSRCGRAGRCGAARDRAPPGIVAVAEVCRSLTRGRPGSAESSTALPGTNYS